jgi:hypothetical protein
MTGGDGGPAARPAVHGGPSWGRGADPLTYLTCRHGQPGRREMNLSGSHGSPAPAWQ